MCSQQMFIEGGAQRNGTCMLYADQDIGQFWKQLALVIAVNSADVKHLNRVFIITAFHCNDRG